MYEQTNAQSNSFKMQKCFQATYTSDFLFF